MLLKTFANFSKEGRVAQQDLSPLTGIIEEDQVFVDFGEHEGKSILEVQDTLPAFYEFLIEQKNGGKCAIRRQKDKSFRLHVSQTVL
jgi:hypothetical protein